MNITEIILKYKNREITREEANKELTEAGASFSFMALTTEELDAKRKAEMEGEFIDIGRKVERIQARPDMKRNKDLAGLVVRQFTKIGQFDIHYNEDGYAVKSVRVQI